MANPSQLLIVAHGSRRQQANQEVIALCQRLAPWVDFDAVGAAFLELAEPSIPDAIDQAVAGGALRVVLLPYFLSEGRHVSEDIPALVEQAIQRHQSIDIVLTPYFGQSPVIVTAMQALLKGSSGDSSSVESDDRADTLVAVANTFPKACKSCGRVYRDAKAFIEQTLPASIAKGIKPAHGNNGQEILEIFRNCHCGATLMSPFYSRRGSSGLASECRQQFDKLVTQMTLSGRTQEAAQGELRQVITGGYADILEQLKKIERPRRSD